jgi:hypothetical protein
MTKFENPSFSVYPGANKNYRDNYDRIFSKKEEKSDPQQNECEVLAPKKMSDLPVPRNAQQIPSNANEQSRVQPDVELKTKSTTSTSRETISPNDEETRKKPKKNEKSKTKKKK